MIWYWNIIKWIVRSELTDILWYFMRTTDIQVQIYDSALFTSKSCHYSQFHLRGIIRWLTNFEKCMSCLYVYGRKHGMGARELNITCNPSIFCIVYYAYRYFFFGFGKVLFFPKYYLLLGKKMSFPSHAF